MNKTNLKKILNALVEGISDKHVLYDLEKEVFPYVIKHRSKKKDKQDDLTDQQKLELEKAILDVDSGNTLTMEEFDDKMEKLHPGYKAQIKKRREKEAKRIKNSSRRKLKKKLHQKIDGIQSKYVLKVLLNDIMPDSLD